MDFYIIIFFFTGNLFDKVLLFVISNGINLLPIYQTYLLIQHAKQVYLWNLLNNKFTGYKYTKYMVT